MPAGLIVPMLFKAGAGFHGVQPCFILKRFRSGLGGGRGNPQRGRDLRLNSPVISPWHADASNPVLNPMPSHLES